MRDYLKERNDEIAKIPANLHFKPANRMLWTDAELAQGKRIAKEIGIRFETLMYHFVNIKGLSEKEYFEAANASLSRPLGLDADALIAMFEEGSNATRGMKPDEIEAYYDKLNEGK